MEFTKIMNGFSRDEIQKGSDRSSDPGKEPVIYEADVFQKNGGKRKVEVSGAQFFLPTGEGHAIIYLKDITDKKHMEECLIQSEKLKALGEMAAGVAHDLNNVLGAILGRVQLIKLGLMKGRGESGRISDETIEQELEIIEQASMDGAHTIQKIQEFTRSKKDESQFISVDVNEMIDKAIELVKTKIKDEAEAKGIQIEVRTIKGEVPQVMGNPSELREVLLNILINSIDAMPEGGTVTFKTGEENDHVFIEASDNGTGIPETIRHRIFDPFFTTKGVRRSGLGLSVSYGIIRRHSGEIQVKSQEGAGTTFMIKLPAAKEEMV
jgi:signal transduction histidine kinase